MKGNNYEKAAVMKANYYQKAAVMHGAVKTF